MSSEADELRTKFIFAQDKLLLSEKETDNVDSFKRNNMTRNLKKKLTSKNIAVQQQK